MNEPSSLIRSCYSCHQNASQVCSKCKKRFYCSRTCQIDDWKFGGHKYFCGESGEVGFDVEIKSTGVQGKGLGLFALRKFQPN